MEIDKGRHNNFYAVDILFPIEAEVVDYSKRKKNRNERNTIQHTETVFLLCCLFFQLMKTMNQLKIWEQ